MITSPSLILIFLPREEAGEESGGGSFFRLSYQRYRNRSCDDR
jgi:hypothetical protein